MKRALVLQHAWDDPPAYLEALLREHHITCELIYVERAPLPDLADYQAVIVMGGPQHVYADKGHPYLAEEKRLLRQAVTQELPTLGICLGAQLLASALGAEVRRHHSSEIGFFEIPLTEDGTRDPLFAGLPGYHLAFHWHQDVFDLPVNALHLASNETAPNQAFRYGPNAYGLQFHIELDDEMAHTWLDTPDFAREICTALRDPNAATRLARVWSEQSATYQKHTRIVFENFLRIGGLVPN